MSYTPTRSRRTPRTAEEVWRWVGIAALTRLSAPALLGLLAAFLIFSSQTTIPATGSVWLGLTASAVLVVLAAVAVRWVWHLTVLACRRVFAQFRAFLAPHALPGRVIPAPAEFTGSLNSPGVYLVHWPAEQDLPPHLRGRGVGGRLAYIGKATRLLDRIAEHARDRREFILPGYGVELRLCADPDARHALEVALIRDADRRGEPIVNVQLHRRR